MNQMYKGIFAVTITPFDEKGNVDEAVLRRHIRFLIDVGGVHGIIPCGSTGEFAFLSEAERKQVVTITVDEVNHQLPVIAGAAACATREVIEYSQHYKDTGVDGVMVVPSYYGGLNQDELFNHYAAIAADVDLPIVLYNNPGTSGSDILPATVARLAQFDNIVAIKESSGVMQRVVDIQLLAGESIQVLCGCDTLSMEMFAMGVTGWIAAPANVAARQCVRLYQLMIEERDHAAAWNYYQKVRPLLDLFEGSGQYVALAKAGLELMGYPVGVPRLPLLPPSVELKAQLKQLLDGLP